MTSHRVLTGILLVGALAASGTILAQPDARGAEQFRVSSKRSGDLDRCLATCDDGDPCTADVCERICASPECARFKWICLADHPPADDGTSCDDGNNDTIFDECRDGTCAGIAETCPCWDGDLRVPDGLGVLENLSLVIDPEPLCDMPPPAITEWAVMCTGNLTLADYVHPEICNDLDIYGSLIRLAYLASDSKGGRRCEAAITDAGYYDMFDLRSRVENLTEVELGHCQALLRQVFECPAP